MALRVPRAPLVAPDGRRAERHNRLPTRLRRFNLDCLRYRFPEGGSLCYSLVARSIRNDGWGRSCGCAHCRIRRLGRAFDLYLRLAPCNQGQPTCFRRLTR